MATTSVNQMLSTPFWTRKWRISSILWVLFTFRNNNKMLKSWLNWQTQKCMWMVSTYLKSTFPDCISWLCPSFRNISYRSDRKIQILLFDTRGWNKPSSPYTKDLSMAALFTESLGNQPQETKRFCSNAIRVSVFGNLNGPITKPVRKKIAL